MSILGQPRALATLQNQLATRRIHHAQLFHGPSGVGKFTLALAFAKTLLCQDPLTDDQGAANACGECASCRLFAAPKVSAAPSRQPAGKKSATVNEDDFDDEDADDLDPAADGDPGAHPLSFSHPDLHIVVKELAAFSDDANVRKRKLTQIPVEIVREHLLEPAHRSPAMNHGKVLIVDEAELLNAAGQNAILKTLEEPPPETTIILVTSREDKLLPTIRSRCQRVAFGALTDAQVENFLMERHPTLEAKKAKWLAIFAQGSPGRALLGLDYGLDEWGRSVVPHLNALTAGRSQPELGTAIASRVEAFAGTWVERHKNASKEAANRLGSDLMLAMLAQWAARRLQEVAAQGAGEEAGAHLAAQEARCAPFLRQIEAVRETETRLAQNANLPMACDGLASAIHAGFGL